MLSNIEPHKEIISVSNAGEIFANTNEITEKITKILENEKKYSDAARKFAKKHSWENIAKEIDKIYMEVLSK